MNQAININQARRQANSYAKALVMTTEGYTYNEICRNLYRVFKPESDIQDKADYVVDLTKGAEHCTCADFEKHGDFCKHSLWVASEEAKKQEAQEEAMWEAICEEYDLREKYEV